MMKLLRGIKLKFTLALGLGLIVIFGAIGVGVYTALGNRKDQKGGSEKTDKKTDKGDGREELLKNPDSTWKYTNRLVNETSPYLLLHAHNPVDWYAWSPEALERAKKENKPIFLSVGYSTCYWCHVMEREVFSNPEIAKLMSQWFISIKVDREERPDIDEIYMTATQLMTGSGGWPNSVFLTPDLKPFFAGTYFPPDDRYGRPGFPKILVAIHEAWENQRDKIIAQANRVASAIRDHTSTEQAENKSVPVDAQLVKATAAALKQSYDDTYGGFGGAPKFPSPMNLEFLLNEYQKTKDKQILDMVTHTLDMMAQGGMYDQVGGGFHRYSTDKKWLIPHFEKMLYDNAQLAKVYAQAYLLTKQPFYRQIAEEIFAFVWREMTSKEGGFYSALDAEVDTEEGKFYVWTEEETQKVLGKEAQIFMKVYGADGSSNFEGGKYVLYLPKSLPQIAKDLSLSEAELQKKLKTLKAKMLLVRDQRQRPLLDTKTLTSWNGLMIDAFAYGCQAFQEPKYCATAQRSAELILQRMKSDEGYLKHSYKDGIAKIDGFLEDYTFLVQGLLSLYETSGEKRWVDEAEKLTDKMIELLWDQESGGFYTTLADQKDLMVRPKDSYDSAIPSGNSTAVRNLLKLAKLTHRKDYVDKAHQTLQNFTSLIQSSPRGFINMTLATSEYLSTDWNLKLSVPLRLKVK